MKELRPYLFFFLVAASIGNADTIVLNGAVSSDISGCFGYQLDGFVAAFNDDNNFTIEVQTPLCTPDDGCKPGKAISLTDSEARHNNQEEQSKTKNRKLLLTIPKHLVKRIDFNDEITMKCYERQQKPLQARLFGSERDSRMEPVRATAVASNPTGSIPTEFTIDEDSRIESDWNATMSTSTTDLKIKLVKIESTMVKRKITIKSIFKINGGNITRIWH